MLVGLSRHYHCLDTSHFWLSMEMCGVIMNLIVHLNLMMVFWLTWILVPNPEHNPMAILLE